MPAGKIHLIASGNACIKSLRPGGIAALTFNVSRGDLYATPLLRGTARPGVKLSAMDPLSPPLGFLVLLSSGWIDRQQQARQQLNAFKRRGTRPPLRTRDRMFWIVLAQTWRHWRASLVLVQPDTVVRWHREWLRLAKDAALYAGRSRPSAEDCAACRVLRPAVLARTSRADGVAAERLASAAWSVDSVLPGLDRECVESY